MCLQGGKWIVLYPSVCLSVCSTVNLKVPFLDTCACLPCVLWWSSAYERIIVGVHRSHPFFIFYPYLHFAVALHIVLPFRRTFCRSHTFLSPVAPGWSNPNYHSWVMNNIARSKPVLAPPFASCICRLNGRYIFRDTRSQKTYRRTIQAKKKLSDKKTSFAHRSSRPYTVMYTHTSRGTV